MRITESKLRRIIRSVIKETVGDTYDLMQSAQDAYDKNPDDLDAYDAMRDAEELDREESLAYDSNLPTHDTYVRDEDLCARYNVPCTQNNIDIIKKSERMGRDPMRDLARRGDL